MGAVGHWLRDGIAMGYFGSADRTMHPQMAIGLAEISIPQTTTTVNIGEHEFKNVPTGLHEVAIFPGEAGLLGNGLISRFSTVTLDAKAGRVILKELHSAQ